MMPTVTPTNEGFLSFRGFRTWYQVVGDLAQTMDGKCPLLLVHGRPVSHESLEPLGRLAETGRPVIFYDQLGCGRSDRPDNPALWTIDLFVDELETVRRELGLERVHLLGHSWGTVSALEYVLTRPDRVASLTLASPVPCLSMHHADWARLESELPPDVQETLHKHEEAGTTVDPAYQEALQVFNLRHICRLDPWPDHLLRALERPAVGTMNADHWDIRPRLGEIRVPTLVTSGRFDFCTPATVQLVHQGIPGSDWVLFEESSHYPHVEETKRYVAVIDGFLTRAERKQQR
jgi:proline-specific peptidase